jgi:NADH-quinone oxidoreductase subunit D
MKNLPTQNRNFASRKPLNSGYRMLSCTACYFSLFLTKNIKNAPTSRRVKNMTLNFGPNHPAAHGILRLTLQLQGEVLQRVDPQFGFLHRGTEKLAEMRSYLQTLPYFDRFDYVANIFQEHVYCLATEALFSAQNSFTFCLNYIRTLFDELSRILNHLLTLSATCLDLGSMGPIF